MSQVIVPTQRLPILDPIFLPVLTQSSSFTNPDFSSGKTPPPTTATDRCYSRSCQRVDTASHGEVYLGARGSLDGLPRGNVGAGGPVDPPAKYGTEVGAVDAAADCGAA